PIDLAQLVPGRPLPRGEAIGKAPDVEAVRHEASPALHGPLGGGGGGEETDGHEGRDAGESADHGMLPARTSNRTGGVGTSARRQRGYASQLQVRMNPGGGWTSASRVSPSPTGAARTYCTALTGRATASSNPVSRVSRYGSSDGDPLSRRSA